MGFEHWTARRFPLCSNTTVPSLVNRVSQVGKSTSIDPSHFGGGLVLSSRPWGLVCPGHLACFLQGLSWGLCWVYGGPRDWEKAEREKALNPGRLPGGGISGLSWNIISKECFTEKESYNSIRKRSLKCTLPWTAAPCRDSAGLTLTQALAHAVRPPGTTTPLTPTHP